MALLAYFGFECENAFSNDTNVSGTEKFFKNAANRELVVQSFAIASLKSAKISFTQTRVLYEERLPSIISKWFIWKKTSALSKIANDVLPTESFLNFKTSVGIVSTESLWGIKCTLKSRRLFASHKDFINYYALS